MEGVRLSTDAVYHIGVAARLTNMHPQTLRLYERLGLISPERTGTNLRLYSDADVERLRRIQRLTQEMGVNLAGVEIILGLLDRVDQLHEEIDRLKHEIEHGPKQLPPSGAAEPPVRRFRVEIR
jgi:MerR family transcriptional regulator, heat shock protein HspR